MQVGFLLEASYTTVTQILIVEDIAEGAES